MRVLRHDGGMPKPFQKPAATPARIALAACSSTLVAGSAELQLFPEGEFRSIDGRPTDAPTWRIDEALAQTLIAAANARTNPYVIDYEHQTLLAKENGQPAPAAGFFRKLEWRPGVGLFAVDVEWKARATEMIAADEYRFASPVFSYDTTGAVTGLFMAAITNNAGIDGMQEILLAAASMQFTTPTTKKEGTQMEELLKKLCLVLNLPAGSAPEAITAELGKLEGEIKKNPDAAAACSLLGAFTSQSATIAALSAATPDPTKYVPIAAMTAVQGQLVALSAQVGGKRVDELVAGAVADGKLLPAQEAWARDLGGKDIAALSAFIATAPSIALLTGTQTQGKAPAAATSSGLTGNQVALCAAMGLPQDQFAATLKAEAKA